MKISRWLRFLNLCVFSVLVTGCVTPYARITNLSPDTLQRGKTVTVVVANECSDRDVWSGRCTQDSGLKTSGSYVTDPPRVSIIASSIGKNAELRSAVAVLNFPQVLQSSVVEHFKPLFESSGLEMKMGRADVRPWTLPQRSKHMVVHFADHHRDSLENDEARIGFATTLNPDYQPVITELNTDYLLVIENLRFGFARQYAPLSIPLEPPTAVAAIRVTLYVASVADPIYDNIVSRRFVPDFEWKTPPDFAELMTLPPQVLDAVIEDAADEFF